MSRFESIGRGSFAEVNTEPDSSPHVVIIAEPSLPQEGHARTHIYIIYTHVQVFKADIDGVPVAFKEIRMDTIDPTEIKRALKEAYCLKEVVRSQHDIVYGHHAWPNWPNLYPLTLHLSPFFDA